MSKKLPALVLLSLLGAAEAGAQSHLLFLELQGVAGYSTARKRTIFYSLSREDVMQKPGLGLRLCSQGFRQGPGTSGPSPSRPDWPMTRRGRQGPIPALQRLLDTRQVLPTSGRGTAAPAFGLSSILDSHALLLPTLAMTGYGFDRDWGVGLSKDLAWGNAAASLTAGSGCRSASRGIILQPPVSQKGF